MSVTNEPGLEINVPLLRKTLEHIEAHPEEHIQSTWAIRGQLGEFIALFEADHLPACGTAFCVAGHAVQFAGHEIEWTGESASSCSVQNATSNYSQSIEETAKKELGLSWPQAAELFAGCNSRERIWALANSYTEGEIEVPEKYL